MDKKNTRQRELIHSFLVFLKQKKLHLSAEEIYQMLKGKSKNISLSTVYRNIKLLEEEGLLNKIETPFGAKYDANTFPHPHLYCVKCGKIEDLPINISLNYDKTKLEKLTGFKINGEHLILYGICKECSNN